MNEKDVRARADKFLKLECPHDPYHLRFARNCLDCLTLLLVREGARAVKEKA